MGRKGVIGQGFPVREQDAAHIRRKKSNFQQQALGVHRVSRDDGREFAFALVAQGQLGQQQSVGRTTGAGEGVALACTEFG